MRLFALLVLVSVLIMGCASLKETIKGIAENPTSYIAEAVQSTSDVKDAVPELPAVVCIGIGYAAAFIRRWYKDIKKEQAKSLKLTDIGKG